MLFKNSITVKSYTGMAGTVEYSSVMNFIEQIEEKELIPITGKELYNTINTAYTSSNDEQSLSEANKKLLHRCRCVIAPYLNIKVALKNDAQLGSDGAKRQETNTAKTPYQYQISNLVDENQREADIATEQLIAFLEENASTFTNWKTSDAWKEYANLFIKSGAEFQKLFSTASPYRNYMAMRHKMYDVENLHMKNFLGASLFNSLKSKDTTGTPEFTENEKELMVMIKKAIAAFTVAFSIPLLNVKLNAEGLTVSGDSARSSSDKLSSRAAAKSEAISLYMNAAEATGKEWMEAAKKFLIEKKTEFTTWPGNSLSTSLTVTSTESLKSLFGLT